MPRCLGTAETGMKKPPFRVLALEREYPETDTRKARDPRDRAKDKEIIRAKRDKEERERERWEWVRWRKREIEQGDCDNRQGAAGRGGEEGEIRVAGKEESSRKEQGEKHRNAEEGGPGSSEPKPSLPTGRPLWGPPPPGLGRAAGL